MNNVSTERYRHIDRRIKRMCKEKKGEWIDRVCREIESNKKRDTKAMVNQIREISGKKRSARSKVIKDRHGNMLTDRDDVLERWKEYVEELYSDVQEDKVNYGEIDPGPQILREDVQKAVDSMK